jgi:N-methylhydantoinase B
MQGLSNRLELEFPDGRCIAPKLKDKIESIPPGSILRQWAGGGGGYGDPYARPVELVQAEVRNELLSIQCAERDYGVQIDGDHARRNGYR